MNVIDEVIKKKFIEKMILLRNIGELENLFDAVFKKKRVQ